MRKTHRSLSSSLEPLESRIAPASVSANAVGGVLKISGITGIPAFFGLQQTGPDSFTLFDTPTTVSFTGIKSILINLGDTNDSMTFGATPGVPSFKGPVTIDTGNSINVGGDAIAFNSSTVFGGTVTIKSDAASIVSVQNGARFFGALKVASPGGAISMGGLAETLTTTELNSVSIEGGGDIKRALTINALESLTSVPAQFFLKSGSTVRGVLSYLGGDANDQITLEGSVLGKTALKLGNGANSVTSQLSYRTASLVVNGGTGPDAVTLNGDFNTTTVGGTTALVLGNGNNAVSMFNVRAGGAIKITGGINNDAVLIAGGLIGGVIQPSLGDGSNSLIVNNSAYVGGGLKVTAGIGNDTVNVGPASIMGPARLALGGGLNIYGNLGGGAQYDGGFAYVGLGGNDIVTLGGAVVKGALNISTGDGDNTVNLFSTEVHGATQLKGGNSGTDTFNVNALANLSGALTINAGNGSNGTTLQSMSNITTLTYNGGSGSDGFQILNAANIPGAGLFTRASVKLGAGTDTFSFMAAGFISFKVDGGADSDQIVNGLPAGLIALNFETGV